MATIREIRRRITAVKSTKKITRAMQLVAAAKLRRAQENILKLRPFAIQMEKVIAQVAMRSKRELHPLLITRKPQGKNLLVVITGDTGLSGGFNSNTLKTARSYFEDHANCPRIDVFCIGRKGRDYFRKSTHSLVGQKINFLSKLKYADAVEIVRAIIDLYLKENYDRVDILYNEFKSAIQLALVVKQFLPLVPAEAPEGITPVEYIYEPDEAAVFDVLIPYSLEMDIWRKLQESYASEMGAKMTAMDAATENANRLLNELSISYNRARQALITRELSEIVGGAGSQAG
jgi:F-type H+-transporting ATPase subunit gamma